MRLHRDTYQSKMNIAIAKVERQLKRLCPIVERYSQNKHHMRAEELDVFYNLRKELVRLKTIYNSILVQANKYRFDPEDDMFEY